MSAPSQFTGPNAAEYGGDEVSAIVLDPGYSSVRAGFAGEDAPKSIVPTYYGAADGGQRLLFGENAVHGTQFPPEIRNPMSTDGLVQDWDAATKLWEYSVTSSLTGKRQTHPSKNGLNDAAEDEEGDVDMDGVEDLEKPLSENPLIMTEPGWTPPKQREKSIEIAMEDWGVPAFWLGRTGVLSAFSAGKPSALVIDIGASTTSVTPVLDGMLLKKGCVKSPLAGNFVSQQCRLLFGQSEPPINITPHFMVASKKPVDAGAKAQAMLRTFESEIPQSFRRLGEERVLTEFKEMVVQVWEGPGKFPGVTNPGNLPADQMDPAKRAQLRPFEFPDGFNQVFRMERYQPVEGLFDAKAALTDKDNPAPKPEQTIPGLIEQAMKTIDVEVRPTLLNNVVIAGGSSLLVGLTKRIDHEITNVLPGPRTRIFAPSNTVERRYASWVGGSILASLGSFHQMWISKKEYEEHGANIIEKRCK
ncbi:Actin/actin-like protein [Eremomyces bilateralis CBS 781.70]|uniref:Actin/actin-like protein n=1 Tax=Eremomyces bilateralis CBS 781.70 TaxID=1392243 RepID=A0A6G1FZG1_9PEZI|nr:Actin/actin-like protein [Eremomyces bilateralis CBS 781.70]KAF1811168.1 Actin/actin-like protein [Eremomyces bilateralis CBS 781.70]